MSPYRLGKIGLVGNAVPSPVVETGWVSYRLGKIGLVGNRRPKPAIKPIATYRLGKIGLVGNANRFPRKGKYNSLPIRQNRTCWKPPFPSIGVSRIKYLTD